MAQEFHSNILLKRWQTWLYIGVFVLITLTLIASNFLALFQGKYPHVQQNGWKNFVSGAPMQALATDLRETPFTDWLGQQQREFGWIALIDAGPRVRLGCPGWLFLMDEFKTHPQAEENEQLKLRIIVHLHKELAKRGTQMVIALVPDKSRIESARLCSLKRPADIESRYTFMISGLTRAHIPVINLNHVLQNEDTSQHPLFYKSDTHWNPLGANYAAQAIASRMQQLGFKPNPAIKVHEKLGADYLRWGDLVRLAGLEKLPDALRPSPDSAQHLSFTYQAEPMAGTDADALFGDNQTTRVALVGTSFSRNAHFADFLAQSLKSEIGNFALDGGGFSKSMLSFIQAEIKSNTLTQWLIWEIPERMLQSPLNTAAAQELLKFNE